MQTRKQFLGGFGATILGGSVKRSLAMAQPITAAIPGGQAIPARKARLVIGDVDLTGPVSREAKEVIFRTPLKPGQMTLQTWLTAEDGTSRGACFVYVRRIPTHASSAA